MFNDTTIAKAVARVRNALVYSLNEKYDITDETKVDGILKVHGMEKDNFDFINNIETLISEGVADASIDQNSNKNETTIAGLFAEATGPVNKIVGYRYLYRKIKISSEFDFFNFILK